MKKPVILAGILFIADQITKILISVFVAYGSSIKVIPFFDFFNITNIRNTGVAFSFFQGRNFLLSIFTAAILLFFCVWLYKNRNGVAKFQFYAFCLVISGGLGNLADRIFRGAVVDFLDFGINSLRWPSFNVADSCVCIGVSLVIIDMINPVFKRKKV
ncbi:MAG: signal peptidase II [Endomicrobia bacterium]|nr:signal peptidase II [Endomicrobiia bacterium]